MRRDASVADPVFQEADQPFLADLVKERPDVRVQIEAHLLAVDSDTECVHGVMGAAPRSETVAKPEEVSLVDRVQKCCRRPLDDLIFQSGDREWALPAIPAWRCKPAGSAMPDRLPDGPVRARPRVYAQGLPRNPSTSTDLRRVQHSP
jgi:hypothetical protein